MIGALVGAPEDFRPRGLSSDHNVGVLEIAAALAKRPPRDDGANLRLAAANDLPGIVDVTSQAIHPDTTEEIWALATDGDVQFLVAEDEGTIVSTMAAIRGRLLLAGVALEFRQVEFVATRPSHRNRGLVAEMLAAVHDAADQARIPLTLVRGLEYFYRQFGYSYAIHDHQRHRLMSRPIMPDGWSVRPAAVSDIPALDALQDSVHRHVDLSVASSASRWEWLIKISHYHLLVAERNGRIEGMARVYADTAGVELSETAARSVPAADAVIAGAADRFADPSSIVVQDRPGGGVFFLERRTDMFVERGALYARATRPELLLESVAPVLEARMARSAYSRWSGRVRLSLYRTGLELLFVEGGLAKVATWQPASEPPRDGDAAIPPELVVDLVMSDLGATGLEQRHPDVLLGDQRPMMRTLFPSVSADLLLH